MYEAIWLLYTLRGLKIPLNSKRFSELLENTPGSVLPLISLDMRSKGLFHTSLPKEKWENNFDYEKIRSNWCWLLAYEGFRNGWLQDKKNLMAKPFFKPMSDRGVIFYDPHRNIPNSKAILKKRRQAQKIQYVNLSRLMFSLRGLEPPDWFEEYE